MERVIELQQITKQFPKKLALNNVSFSINKGEVVAILGPNGAGKTTLMHIMLGLLSPSAGEVNIFNQPTHKRKVRDKIGAMLQDVSLMDGVKVIELLQLFTTYYSNPMPLQLLKQLTNLSETDLKMRTEKLSGGQKRRVSFALSLAGNPELLFFDEPTVGMDIASRQKFWRTIQQYAKAGKTVVFTTHYLQEADDFANRILLLNQGHLIQDGSLEAIKRNVSRQIVSFLTHSLFPFPAFKKLPYVLNIYEKENRIMIETNNVEETIAALFAKNIRIKDLQIEKGRLEDAFSQLTNVEELEGNII